MADIVEGGKNCPGTALLLWVIEDADGRKGAVIDREGHRPLVWQAEDALAEEGDRPAVGDHRHALAGLMALADAPEGIYNAVEKDLAALFTGINAFEGPAVRSDRGTAKALPELGVRLPSE